MSKTDKTKPWWVKVIESPVEVHDHANGQCEIAGKRPSPETIGGRRRGKCYFDTDWWRPEFRCGCELCGIPQSERRKRRRENRVLERNWWREAEWFDAP